MKVADMYLKLSFIRHTQLSVVKIHSIDIKIAFAIDLIMRDFLRK